MPGSSVKGKLTISKWFQQIPDKTYIEQFQLDKYYDMVFVADIQNFKPSILYDIIILGDIIEHLPNEKSIKVLKRLFKKSRYCIISLPLDAETNAPSENSQDYWHNQHEEHTGRWSNRSIIQTIKDLGGELIAMEK